MIACLRWIRSWVSWTWVLQEFNSRDVDPCFSHSVCCSSRFCCADSVSGGPWGTPSPGVPHSKGVKGMGYGPSQQTKDLVPSSRITKDLTTVVVVSCQD